MCFKELNKVPIQRGDWKAPIIQWVEDEVTKLKAAGKLLILRVPREVMCSGSERKVAGSIWLMVIGC